MAVGWVASTVGLVLPEVVGNNITGITSQVGRAVTWLGTNAVLSFAGGAIYGDI